MNGTCLKPATTRVVLTTDTGVRVGFRCDEHPIPECVTADGTAKVFVLTDNERRAA